MDLLRCSTDSMPSVMKPMLRLGERDRPRKREAPLPDAEPRPGDALGGRMMDDDRMAFGSRMVETEPDEEAEGSRETVGVRRSDTRSGCGGEYE